MTACTNNGGSRARRAVTAALVGVLSVGAAPMVALATGAAPASGDVILQADTSNTVWNGTVTYEGEDTYVYNGDPQGMVAVSIKPFGGAEPEDLEYHPAGAATENGSYYYFYVKIDTSSSTVWESLDGEPVKYENADGRQVNLKGECVNKPTDPGEYAVVVGLKNGGWELNKSAERFVITSRSLEGAQIVEDENVDDTEFMWNGTLNGRTVSELKKHMNVSLDGVILDEGEDYDDIEFYEKGATTPLSRTDQLEPGVTYTAKIVGKGAYDWGNAETLDFTLQPLDLDEATVTGKVGTVVLSNASEIFDVVDSINGVTVQDGGGDGVIGDKYFGVSFEKSPSDDGIAGDTGRYTFTVVPTKEATDKGWVTGSKTVEAIYADHVVNIVNASDADGDGVYYYDLTNEDAEPFDVEDVTATTDNGYSVDEDDVSHVVTAEDGSVATDADLAKGGTWYVTYSVYYRDSNGSLIAGNKTYKVVNSYDDITDEHVYVTLDGKNVEGSTEVTYDGSDWADKLKVMVAKNDVTLAEGTDYTVAIKDEDGKTVDSVVDAGEYTVVVKGITFTNSISFTIEVKPAVVEWLFPNYNVVTDDTLESGKYAGFFAYTGDVIDATYTCVDDKGKVIEVPASAFTITYTLDGKKAELKEAGEYLGTIKDTTVNDNWQVGNKFGVQKIVVSKDKVFADVKSSDFFAQAIYTASAQGYIGGIGGTNLFAPMNQLTRADMACVLYRMAGGEISASLEDLTNENIATISQFSDVDPHAYYAKAVAWCVEMGVANGYGDTFGSARSISTEEFVTMLARYAAKMGDDTSVDTDAVLAATPDGDQVSGYARDAVAWAVENGYIAKGGNLIAPQESVARWRTVMIAVDYQPEQLHVIGNPDATKPGTGEDASK